MQTKVIYLNGNLSDEEKLNGFAEQGYKLQSTQLYQGQIVGYLVREPWLDPQPILVQGPPVNLQQPNKLKESAIGLAKEHHKKKK